MVLSNRILFNKARGGLARPEHGRVGRTGGSLERVRKSVGRVGRSDGRGRVDGSGESDGRIGRADGWMSTENAPQNKAYG